MSQKVETNAVALPGRQDETVAFHGSLSSTPRRSHILDAGLRTIARGAAVPMAFKIFALATLLVPGLFSNLVAAKPTVPIVDLGYAKYQGNLTWPDAVSYLGIEYAEPPLGDKRFRSPVTLNTTRVQHEAGGKPINATAFPLRCIQMPIWRTSLSLTPRIRPH